MVRPRVLNNLTRSTNTLFDSAWKSQFLTGLMFPIMNFVGNLGYVVICILGGYLAVKGTMPIGDIQAFIQYVRSFTQPITQIANISNILQQTMAAAERVFEFLDEPEEIPTPIRPIQMANSGRSCRFQECSLRLQSGQDHHQ